MGSAGYIVEAGNTMLKLDFGRSNLQNMAAAGIDWKKINAILISHTHPDHVSDLVQYFQAYTLYHRDGKIESDVEMFGPNGFTAFFEHLRRVIITPWDHIPMTQDLFDDRIIIGEATIITAETEHTVSAVGYRIEHDNKVLCYTGDTALSDNLRTLAANADVLLTECAGDADGHMTPEQVGELARDAKVKKVVLTHYPAEESTRQEYKKRVEGNCEVEVIAGYDLQVVEM